MSATKERIESYEPMHELATDVAAEMGETAEERLTWLLGQDADSFGGVLLRVNATARDIPLEQHGFDGEGVQAGTIAGSIPPDQEDKVLLLGELLQASQQHAREQLEKGEDPQTIMAEVAMAVPVVINKLHLFSDGNGRTSRFMRMVLRDGDQLSPEKTELLISKDGTEKYDTTPAMPVERAILPAIRAENGTDTLSLVQDVFNQEEVVFVEDEAEALRAAYPDLDTRIIKAYEDTFNFSESLRLIAKNEGLDGKISIKQLLDKVAASPEGQRQLLEAYRGVRKQRVELLIAGLLGKKDIRIAENSKARELQRWTGYARKQKGLAEIDPDTIQTVQDFQMAYMEAFSPARSD